VSDNLAGAVIGAMVGDYLLQNDWLALGKKRSSVICAIHCTVWTIAVLVFANNYNWLLALWLFTTHFAIDRTAFISWWMNNISGQKGFAKNLSPWSMIVVDNCFHLVTVWVGFKFIATAWL